MEYVIAFLIGFALSSVAWIGMIRRAAKKPDGNTGKFVQILKSGGGGGPDPGTP